jgi:hypothetical protein
VVISDPTGNLTPVLEEKLLHAIAENDDHERRKNKLKKPVSVTQQEPSASQKGSSRLTVSPKFSPRADNTAISLPERREQRNFLREGYFSDQINSEGTRDAPFKVEVRGDKRGDKTESESDGDHYDSDHYDSDHYDSDHAKEQNLSKDSESDLSRDLSRLERLCGHFRDLYEFQNFPLWWRANPHVNGGISKHSPRDWFVGVLEILLGQPLHSLPILIKILPPALSAGNLFWRDPRGKSARDSESPATLDSNTAESEPERSSVGAVAEAVSVGTVGTKEASWTLSGRSERVREGVRIGKRGERSERTKGKRAKTSEMSLTLQRSRLVYVNRKAMRKAKIPRSVIREMLNPGLNGGLNESNNNARKLKVGRDGPDGSDVGDDDSKHHEGVNSPNPKFPMAMTIFENVVFSGYSPSYVGRRESGYSRFEET